MLFTFCSVFKWESRKGWDTLLTAYWAEFKVRFVFKMMDFVLTMINFVLKMMDFVFKMMNFVSK